MTKHQKLPDNIYATSNVRSGEHNGYRVLMQHGNKKITKNFCFRKYPDALQKAIEFRDEYRVPSKRPNCSTGFIGVTRTHYTRSNKMYLTFVAHWRVDKGGKEMAKNFTFATLNLHTNEWDYSTDAEFNAYRCAVHFRTVAQWYKNNGLGKEFVKLAAINRDWRICKPENMFHD